MKQRPKLVLAIIIESKPVSKVNSVRKTAFGAKVPNQEKGKGQVLRRGYGIKAKKLEAILVNIWTAAHPRPDGKSLVPKLMGA
ncbi:hypothetical protein ACTXT7_010317 [Hymenolepis weldensis]